MIEMYNVKDSFDLHTVGGFQFSLFWGLKLSAKYSHHRLLQRLVESKTSPKNNKEQFPDTATLNN